MSFIYHYFIMANLDYWEQLLDPDNLKFALRGASKGKHYSIVAVDYRLDQEAKLTKLEWQLRTKKYEPSPFRQFYVTDPKRRLISAPQFRDRIVHHALIQIIDPMYEKRFIDANFACRVGKGTHAAVKHVHRKIKNMYREYGNNFYILKCDIKSFFASVHHEVLKADLRQVIHNMNILWLCDKIIDHYSTERTPGRGIPIGSLTSQLFANVYMDQLDHYLKHKLGVRNYARYMDDFVVLHREKQYLVDLLHKIKIYVEDVMLVTLNPKTDIFPIKNGVDFCGYRLYPTHLKIRKRTLRKARRQFKSLIWQLKNKQIELEDVDSYIASFIGGVLHSNDYRSAVKILDKFDKDMNEWLLESRSIN